MKVKVFYYAMLRERRKLDREEIETKALTAQELYTDLSGKYHFGIPVSSVKVAVNNVFSPWSYELKEGDEVIFVPPVAGG